MQADSSQEGNFRLAQPLVHCPDATRVQAPHTHQQGSPQRLGRHLKIQTSMMVRGPASTGDVLAI